MKVIYILISFFAVVLSAEILELKSSAKVKGAHFLLEDVIVSSNGKWKNVVLDRSPVLGEIKEYSRDDISTRLLLKGLSIDSIRWKGAQSVTIETLAMEIPSNHIISLAQEYIGLSLPLALENHRYTILRAPDDGIEIPRPRKSIKISPYFPTPPHYLKMLRINVIVEVDSQKIKDIPLAFRIKAFANVFVTRSYLRPKTILNVSHLKKHFIAITSLKKLPIVSLTQLLGKRTLRPLSSGHILTKKDVQRPPMINKGSKIKLLFRSGKLKIYVKAQALEDGYHNEEIRILNLVSRKVLKAKVINAKTTLIE